MDIPSNNEQILDALKAVNDPEVGINIIDLGLVYSATLNLDEIDIQLTMTSPACPLHEVIAQDMKNVIQKAFPGIKTIKITLVWEPPWSPEMMSDAAKKQLGW